MKKFLCAVTATAICWAQPAAADVLVDNVNGYTLDATGKLARFTGMILEDDGRVRSLLQRKDKKPERTTYRIDGRGRTLIPGLIDAHGHFMSLGYQALQIDLTGTNSLQEAQAKVAAYAAANPAARWIVGRGWNQERWGLGRFPTAAELDAAVADRPVWLERIDGHAGWANSMAMREAGVSAGAGASAGGRIETADGKPSGIFVDAAMELVTKAIPAPLPRISDSAFDKAQQTLLAMGLTTIQDMGTSAADWLVIRRAADRNGLLIRIISYADSVDTALAIAGAGPSPWLYGGRLRMVGVKYYSDGALGSRGAWLKADYLDAPGHRGLPLNNDAKLKNLMSRAAMDGFQVAVHAIGDAANAQILDAFAELADTYDGDRRWRIEHAQIVDPADLPRFANNGIIASMQPVHALSDWKMAEARMGIARLGAAYAWASMIANKVPLAFGSDFPVESSNPFAGLAEAISRENAGGQPPGGWIPQQRISLEQAFAAFTSGAAFAAFAEDRLGTLQPGRQADFLFIDRDIFADGATTQLIRGTQVVETWIGGRKAWDRRGPEPKPDAARRPNPPPEGR